MTLVDHRRFAIYLNIFLGAVIGLVISKIDFFLNLHFYDDGKCKYVVKGFAQSGTDHQAAVVLFYIVYALNLIRLLASYGLMETYDEARRFFDDFSKKDLGGRSWLLRHLSLVQCLVQIAVVIIAFVIAIAVEPGAILLLLVSLLLFVLMYFWDRPMRDALEFMDGRTTYGLIWKTVNRWVRLERAFAVVLVLTFAFAWLVADRIPRLAEMAPNAKDLFNLYTIEVLLLAFFLVDLVWNFVFYASWIWGKTSRISTAPST